MKGEGDAYQWLFSTNSGNRCEIVIGISQEYTRDMRAAIVLIGAYYAGDMRDVSCLRYQGLALTKGLFSTSSGNRCEIVIDNIVKSIR